MKVLPIRLAVLGILVSITACGGNTPFRMNPDSYLERGSTITLNQPVVVPRNTVAAPIRGGHIGDRYTHEAHCRLEVKTLGDGFLATFDGPARAIQCARSIRDSMHELGADVRIGLHTGEVEVADDDVHGIAVHIASRVANLGSANDVLVTRTVKDLVAGSGISFQEFGNHMLKGVPDEWQLYRAQ